MSGWSYDKINLMIPSYKRQRRLAQVVETALNTASKPDNVYFTLCINEKDDTYDGMFDKLDRVCIVRENTDQPFLSRYYNLMYHNTEYKDDSYIISQIGDDMIFKTVGWDEKIIASMNDSDGKAIVYCDDGYIAHEKCCVNLFTTRRMVKATERPFMCEHFKADMIDVVWYLTGLYSCTLKYLSDVIILHAHDSALSLDQRDETWKRLDPVRQANNTTDKHQYAIQYATKLAFNLIRNGIGRWNTI